MFRRKKSTAVEEEHSQKKHRAYELSIAGRYDGIFALADDQRPGDGDVSILRVRLPPQFEMAGALELKVGEGENTIFHQDGGVGEVANAVMTSLPLGTGINFAWNNVMNFRSNIWRHSTNVEDENLNPEDIMSGHLTGGWGGHLPLDSNNDFKSAILDIELRENAVLKEIVFWPERQKESQFPKEIVLEKIGGFQTNYSADGTYVDVEQSGIELATLSLSQPLAYTAADPPLDVSTGANRYVFKQSLNCSGFLRIRISQAFVGGNNPISGSYSFEIGEIMLVSETPAGSEQTRLSQPFFTGTPHQEGSRLYVHDNSYLRHNGTQYVGTANVQGVGRADAAVFNSFSARTQLRNVVLDAFTNNSSTKDKGQKLTTTLTDCFGMPSFVWTAPTASVAKLYVKYRAPGETIDNHYLLYALRGVTSGSYAITHKNAFIQLKPGQYALDTDSSSADVVMIDHHTMPTLTFSSNGSSAYGLSELQVDNFFGTIEMNDLLRHRLGFQLTDGFIQLQNGVVQGVTRLNDVKRISLYLEPSVQFHVSSHIGQSGDSIAENTLTVISFTISGDDLDDTALYSLSSDFDVNSARMTSNKSAQIQFKVFKDVYDPLAKTYLSKPILLSDTEFVEIKMVVSQTEVAR